MRLMLFDRTCTRTGRLPLGLTHAWSVGGGLYRMTHQLDAVHGITDWSEGLAWLATFDAIDEVQFWGHGHWGRAQVGREPLDRSALQRGHALHRDLEAVRDRLTPESQWWFRTCDTLGAQRGQDFTMAFADFLGCAVAGHTHIIGVLQSGLHRLAPGRRPHWSALEGVAEGTAQEPTRSTWSGPGAPNTIHMLQGRVPEGW